jgi:cytochrome P450
VITIICEAGAAREGGTLQFEEVDFFSEPSLFDDPYPYFDYLREHKGPVWIEPVYRVAMITGHDEELAVLRDHDAFSSLNAPSGPFAGLPAVSGDDATEVMERCREQMPMHEFLVCMDPPEHNELRGVLSRFFTPRRLKDNEEFMWRLADDQMDPFLRAGECEFGTQYASPFAGLVIADLLGVPSEDMPMFRRWFEQQLEDVANPEISGDPLTFLQDSFTRYILERRDAPRNDVLTGIAEATFSDGSQPDVAALAREAAFIFAAGQETTVRLLTFSMRYLAEDPGVQERLRADRALIPNFVEEMLRLESPIKVHFRLARRTTTLGGVTIPAGTTVALLNGAANRDPRRFDAPEDAQIERANAREHVAFSRGVHSCLGQSLARAEARVTLERVLDRMTDVRVSDRMHGPPAERRWEYLPTWLFRGLTELHLEFTAPGS